MLCFDAPGGRTSLFRRRRLARKGYRYRTVIGSYWRSSHGILVSIRYLQLMGLLPSNDSFYYEPLNLRSGRGSSPHTSTESGESLFELPLAVFKTYLAFHARWGTAVQWLSYCQSSSCFWECSPTFLFIFLAFINSLTCSSYWNDLPMKHFVISFIKWVYLYPNEHTMVSLPGEVRRSYLLCFHHSEIPVYIQYK